MKAAEFRKLSEDAGRQAEECSRRGDTEGSFYARGQRDAYALAASFGDFAPEVRPLSDRGEFLKRWTSGQTGLRP